MVFPQNKAVQYQQMGRKTVKISTPSLHSQQMSWKKERGRKRFVINPSKSLVLLLIPCTSNYIPLTKKLVFILSKLSALMGFSLLKICQVPTRQLTNFTRGWQPIVTNRRKSNSKE